MYAHVLIELKVKQLDQLFTYHIPDDLIFKIKVGMRVFVPFGRQKLEGFVINITDQKPEYNTKDILEIIDLEPVLNSEMLELGAYISKRTMSSLISAYQTMLPNALKAHHGFNVNIKYIVYILRIIVTCL